MTQKQNLQTSRPPLFAFLVLGICLLMSVSTFAQETEAILSATIEPEGKSKSTTSQASEDNNPVISLPNTFTSISSSSSTEQKKQKNGGEEYTIDGPFCNGCDNPKSGSSLACSGGANAIIQGIDISQVNKTFLVNSIDFNQESFGGAPNVAVRLFCGTDGNCTLFSLHTQLSTPKPSPQRSQMMGNASPLS